MFLNYLLLLFAGVDHSIRNAVNLTYEQRFGAFFCFDSNPEQRWGNSNRGQGAHCKPVEYKSMNS
jgi:hypothetical protein